MEENGRPGTRAKAAAAARSPSAIGVKRLGSGICPTLLVGSLWVSQGTRCEAEEYYLPPDGSAVSICRGSTVSIAGNEQCKLLSFSLPADRCRGLYDEIVAFHDDRVLLDSWIGTVRIELIDDSGKPFEHLRSGEFFRVAARLGDERIACYAASISKDDPSRLAVDIVVLPADMLTAVDVDDETITERNPERATAPTPDVVGPDMSGYALRDGVSTLIRARSGEAIAIRYSGRGESPGCVSISLPPTKDGTIQEASGVANVSVPLQFGENGAPIALEVAGESIVIDENLTMWHSSSLPRTSFPPGFDVPVGFQFPE